MSFHVIKKQLFRLAGGIHLRIFGYEMGAEIKQFLGHLSWSFFGGIIAAGIMFALNILAGRWLGPAEYGKYGLIVAISSVFVVFMVLGSDTAATHYIAKAKDEDERKRYTGSSFLVVFFCMLTSILIAIFFSPLITDLFSFSSSIFFFSLVVAIFLSLKGVGDSQLRGYHLFKIQSGLKIIEASIAMASFFLLYRYFKIMDFQAYVGPLLVGYFFSSLIMFWYLRKKIYFSTVYAKKIILYGLYAISGSLSGIMIGSFDKIFVGRYLGNEILGIYTAYLTVSLVVAGQFIALFVNVFFPFFSSLADTTDFLEKINRISKYSCVPAAMLIFLTTYFGISLFGKSYPVDWLLIIELTLYTMMTAYFSILWWLINSKGIQGIKFSSKHALIGGVCFLILMGVFRFHLTLHLVVFFLIVAMTYNLVVGNLFYRQLKIDI